MADMQWRVGKHYGIHVYEGDRPVATFHSEEDAQRCVKAVNGTVSPQCLSLSPYLGEARGKPPDHVVWRVHRCELPSQHVGMHRAGSRSWSSFGESLDG